MSKKRRDKMKAKASRHAVSKPVGQPEKGSKPIPPAAPSNTKSATVGRAKPSPLLKEAAPEWGSYYSSIQAAVREIG